MIKKIFLALFLSAVGFVIYLYTYLGFSREVQIEVGERGPLYLLYKNHLGAYHQIGPTITAAENWTNANNVLCPQTFGEFLDDPKTMDQDRLRSRAGCVLDRKLNDPPGDFVYEERPRQKYIIARFAGSPSIGPFKVYPKVRKYIEDNRLKPSSSPVIEIYTISGANVTTEYLFPGFF
jgi:AraC family transcriptional regulator